MEKNFKSNGVFIKYDPNKVKMDGTNLIYKLTYPELNKVYIGLVSGNAEARTLMNRINEHTQKAQAFKNNGDKTKKRVYDYDKALLECKFVRLEVLEECPNAIIASRAEKRHIAAEAKHVVLYSRNDNSRKLSRTKDKNLILQHMFNQDNLFYK